MICSIGERKPRMGTSTFREIIQHRIQQLAQPQSSPQAVALTFGLGTLIAILPTPGFGIFVGMALVLVFKSLSKIAMAVSITLWNPILQVPVYYSSYVLGSWLLGQPAVLNYDESWISIMTHYTQAFLLGNSILASVISAASYGVLLQLMILHHRRKAISELISFHQYTNPVTEL